MYTLATYRTRLAAEAYQPCLAVDHTDATLEYLAVSICDPALPEGVNVMYAVSPVPIEVHVDACGVSSLLKLKKALPTSTLLPAAITDCADVVKLVSVIAWNPNSELTIVRLVLICALAIYRSSSRFSE